MHAYFNVRPRYSAGSPAMVDEETALQVADEERTSYKYALEGVWGLPDKERAEVLGLRGCAEKVVERRGRWEVTDLITEEMYERPIPGNKRVKKPTFAYAAYKASENLFAVGICRLNQRGIEIVPELGVCRSFEGAHVYATKQNERYCLEPLPVLALIREALRGSSLLHPRYGF